MEACRLLVTDDDLAEKVAAYGLTVDLLISTRGELDAMVYDAKRLLAMVEQFGQEAVNAVAEAKLASFKNLPPAD